MNQLGDYVAPNPYKVAEYNDLVNTWIKNGYKDIIDLITDPENKCFTTKGNLKKGRVCKLAHLSWYKVEQILNELRELGLS